jgi:hypothetical protein
MDGELRLHMETLITLEIIVQHFLDSLFVSAVCVSVVRAFATPKAVSVNVRLKLPMTITPR